MCSPGEPFCIISAVDAAEALSKAEQFANTAYNVALEEIVVRTQGEIRAMRNKLAAEGSLLTGRNTAATVQLRAKCISELVQARLDALLEGYELYGVPLDDEREANIITKVLDLRDTQISNAKKAASGDASLFNPAVYCGMLDGECRVSHNSIKVQIERRRRIGKNKEPVPTNVYHVYGHNTRVNTNSTDQSVNV